MGEKELTLNDKNITSLQDILLSPTITSLNLHCNHIQRIEGLTSAWHLRYIDLSSNCISKIEGLCSLTSLRTLNLSCNLITKVEGLNCLVNLTQLNLAHNKIDDLNGLLFLHGLEYKLKHLSLQGNQLDSIDHLLQCLQGLQGLREITLSKDGRDNPVCQKTGYWEIIMQCLPQISVLDGLDRLGNPSHRVLVSPCDIPGLVDYVDLLLSSDTSHNEAARGDGPLNTPRIDEVLTKFRQRVSSKAITDKVTQLDHESCQSGSPTAALPSDPVNEERIRKLEHQMFQLIQQVPTGDKSQSSINSTVMIQKAKRDTDRTSESECDSGKVNKRRTRIPRPRNSVSLTTPKDTMSQRSDSDQENPQQMRSKSALGPRRKTVSIRSMDATETTRKVTFGADKTSGKEKSKSTEELETFRVIVSERDQERERRWKAEQAVRKLTEDLRRLQTKVCEEKDLQSMAMHTTDRLKELLLKERSRCSELQTRVDELEGKCQSLTLQLERAHSCEEQHKTAQRRLQETISHGEALGACQQAEEMKRHQELEKKAAALKRELDIQRASVCQHKDKLQQLHELLASREQEHRKQLDLRLQPGSADFRGAVATEVASAEQRHAQREVDLQDKLAEGMRQYAALEDEFRMALTIEAARFSEVTEAFDQVSAELVGLKETLVQSQQGEKKSRSLVQELTAIVKEQKNRISELIKAKRYAVTDLKGRVQSLEAKLEQEQRLGLQLELLKKEKAQLLSQVTAQESVIDGLRAERRIWGQELAQQGVSLAQDRGRLEARIEVLGTELETQKKQIERDNDALKIKAKIIEDQTQTIRKLKEGLLQREDQIRTLREELVQSKKRIQQQREEETAQLDELKDWLEHQTRRKEELKQQLEVKEAELDDERKWRQEKEDLLRCLKSEVKCKVEKFDANERLLLEETDKAREAHKAAMEKLRCMDDAFRRQLESVTATHQVELLQLENEKQKLIEEANQKVFEVEDEMRQLLEETETNKRIMEEKMKPLTNALRDLCYSCGNE